MKNNQLQLFLLISLCWVATGCAKVKLAIYDEQKRLEYAGTVKERYLESPEGKAYSLKSGMLHTAETYLGAPYKYGGTDPKKGFDCSGFVYTVAGKQHIQLPRSSTAMAQAAPHIPIKKAEPGDLIFFGLSGRIHHVGIIEKNAHDQLIVIHSSTQNGVIRENMLASPYWKKRILFATDMTAYQAPKTKP